MTRVRINQYTVGSNGVANFKAGLVAAGVDAAILKRTNSRFRARSGDIIINYGDSQFNPSYPEGVTLLNKGTAISTASNKRSFFATINQWNESTPESSVPVCGNTTDSNQAQEWVDAGEVVYARTVLSGHSGNGIVVVNQGDVLPRAQLYTKGIVGSRREYRVHVFNGEPILVQLKKRRNGFTDLENSSDTVRNLNGGWVFAISNAAMSSAIRTAAVNAVAALGLDFGAVDIIAKGRRGNESEVYVLEINTAPGQQGDTTTERYVEAIQAVIEHRSYSPYVIEEVEAVTQEPLRVPDPVEVPPTNVSEGIATQPNLNSSYANDEHYFLTYLGNRTVGCYEAPSQQFYLIGIDVPVSVSDISDAVRIAEIQ